MRVAHLIPCFSPLIGGAERQLLGVAPLQQALGLDVHVVTRWHPGLDRREDVRGVPVHRLGSPGGGRGSLAYTAQAQLLLRRLAPDVLHAHELLSPTTTALLARRHLRVPVVAKVLGGGELDVLAARPLGRRRLAAALRGVDAFHVVSDQIDRLLAQAGVPGHQRRTIPNGVDTKVHRPATATERQHQRERLGIDPTAPVLLALGRLSPEKGMRDLLAAWPAVRARQPSAVLLMAGTGPEEAALRRAAGEGVRLLGPVLDVVALLHSADVFVLPSHAEGASNALLEAFACGVPAVATGVGGSVELAGGGTRALLVPPRDPSALAHASCTALEDREAARARARSARDWVVTERSLEAAARSLAGLYADLVPTPLRERVTVATSPSSPTAAGGSST